MGAACAQAPACAGGEPGPAGRVRRRGASAHGARRQGRGKPGVLQHMQHEARVRAPRRVAARQFVERGLQQVVEQRIRVVVAREAFDQLPRPACRAPTLQLALQAAPRAQHGTRAQQAQLAARRARVLELQRRTEIEHAKVTRGRPVRALGQQRHTPVLARQHMHDQRRLPVGMPTQQHSVVAVGMGRTAQLAMARSSLTSSTRRSEDCVTTRWRPPSSSVSPPLGKRPSSKSTAPAKVS